jgi:adenosylcobinamide-GDP ribazoletransferase
MSPLAARPASRAPSPRAAVAFLTRLPVGGGALTAAQLSRSALWFPAVGLLVGGVMAGVHALAGTVLDATPATVLALLAAMLVTGALHEDGLADAADAIGAHVPRERRLEILRDSRVGAYGALALVFCVLFALAVLAPLDDGDFLRAALVGHAVGRWSILPQSLLLPAARPDGAGALMRAGTATTAVATAYTIAIALVAGRPAAGAVALGVAALLTALGVVLFRRTLGGATGDTFGALVKVVELGCYAALVAMWA